MHKPGGESSLVRDAYEVLQVRSDASQIVVQAAFRALAAAYHPDAGNGSTRRMAELNEAYAQIRTPDRRAVYDRIGQPGSTIRPEGGEPQSRPARAATRNARGAGVLDFGRYAGWAIADLARHDPDYLRWLSRHSSGIHFRRAIEQAICNIETAPTASQRTRGR